MPIAGRLLRDPRFGLLVAAVVVVAAAVLGHLWQALGLMTAFAVLAWCWWDDRGARRLAVLALFASQMMMAAIWLHPAELNYVAYAVLLMLAAGLAAALHGQLRAGVLLGALGWLLVSAVYSTLVLHPAPVYALLVAPLGLIAIYLLHAAGTEGDLRYFLSVLLGFAVVQAGIGVAQTVFGLPGFAAFPDSVYTDARNYLSILLPVSSVVRMATGTFEHFNGLGALLALSAPLAFNGWLERRSFGRAIVLATIVAGLVATFSRGALLGALVACTMLYVVRGRGSFSYGLRAATTTLMVLLGGLTAYQAISTYASATGHLGSRLGAWVLALGATFADPVRVFFGAGFGYYASGYLTEHGAIARLHSAPVQAFSELGIVGVALLSAALFPPIVRGLRSNSNMQRCLAASGTAFLIHQLFDNALFGIGGVAFVGVLTGLIALQRRGNEEEGTLQAAGGDAV